MTRRPTLDVSHLPQIAFGSRAPIWWGQVGMMTIETTIFAIIVAAYFYVRLGFSVWPPPNIAPPDLELSTLNLILLILSCIPMYLGGKAVMERNFGRAILLIALNILMALVFLILRTVELNRWNFKWTSDVYGSLVWTLIGMHTMHVIADTVESMVVLAIFVTGRAGGKQQLGSKLDGLYWYWVTAVWVPLYMLIFVYPAVTKYA